MEQGPPKTLEEAVESVRWYQHVHGAAVTSGAERPRAHVRGWSPDRDSWDRHNRRGDTDSQYERYRESPRPAQQYSTYQSRPQDFGRYKGSPRAEDFRDRERVRDSWDNYQVRAVSGGWETAMAELTKQVGGLVQEVRGIKTRLDSMDSRLSKVEAWDAISRMPVGGFCENYQGHGDLAALPCRGCSYCSRAHKNWNSFLMEVDDVGQLRDQAQGVHMLPILGRVQQVSWAQALTPEEIQGVQQNDEELAIVVKWMEGGEVPDENVLAMGSPAMKFYWVNKNLMKFKDTILMYSKGDKDLILTPRGLVESVLNLAHNVPSGGGGGIRE